MTLYPDWRGLLYPDFASVQKDNNFTVQKEGDCQQQSTKNKFQLATLK